MMDKKKSITYAEAMERLEAIMAEIQSGRVDVDTLAELLKEADEKIKFCRKKLYKVDKEVQAVLQNIGEDVMLEG